MHTNSARLTLREITLDDVEHIYALDSIPENARYQTWPPRTRDEAENVVHQAIYCATESPRVFVEQVVFVPIPIPIPIPVLIPSSGGDTPPEPTFIGRVGAHIDAAARTAELWFSFMPSAQGRGYATEAVAALVEMLRAERDAGRVPHFDCLLIECDPRNTRSSRLAERAGFVLQSCTENAFECKGEWVGSLVYGREVDLVATKAVPGMYKSEG
ncbi:acyl-CoA N-acyltransferase [Mycena galopus ATCC 62051]|nr:acyl-CoA N-acyltransferase [Mycena galopus ATCC 62051]